MAIIQFNDFYQTELSFNITDSTNEIIVVNATPPANLPAVFLIDNELVLLNSASTTTWTVERGFEGTTPSAHLAGAQVTAVISKAVLDQVSGKSKIMRGTYAAKPSPEMTGRLYFPTDAPYILYDTGSVWEHYGPVLPNCQPPRIADFPYLVRTSQATIVDSPMGLSISVPSTATDRYMMIGQDSPGTTNFSVEFGVKTIETAPSVFGIGVVGWRDSDNKGMVAGYIDEQYYGGRYLCTSISNLDTTPTGFASYEVSNGFGDIRQSHRLVKVTFSLNGSNNYKIDMDISFDGVTYDYIPISGTDLLSHMPNSQGVITKVGIFLFGTACQCNVFNWKVYSNV